MAPLSDPIAAFLTDDGRAVRLSTATLFAAGPATDADPVGEPLDARGPAQQSHHQGV